MTRGSVNAMRLTRNPPTVRIELRSANCNQTKEEDNMGLNDINSLSHSKWNCKYHIVFAPKYRRKILYGEKAVSSFMGYLKGKSTTMLYEQFGELKYKYRNREFWCKGYYVDTVGKNESRIAEYIKHQLDEDKLGEQLSISEVEKYSKKKK